MERWGRDGQQSAVRSRTGFKRKDGRYLGCMSIGG